jgi:hypothetical protein
VEGTSGGTPTRTPLRPVPRALARIVVRERWSRVLVAAVLLPCWIWVLTTRSPGGNFASMLLLGLVPAYGALVGPLQRRLTWVRARRGPTAAVTVVALTQAYEKALRDARSARALAWMFLGFSVAQASLQRPTAFWHGAALIAAPLLAGWAVWQAMTELQRLQAGEPGRPRPPRLDRVFS